MQSQCSGVNHATSRLVQFSFKCVIKVDLPIYYGRKFHSAGPATSEVLFSNCRFARLTKSLLLMSSVDLALIQGQNIIM